MTLTRQNVTAASRIMLPTYVIFFAWLGLSYIFGPDAPLTAAPALAFADALMPLVVWGWLFVACAVVMTAALLLHLRLMFRFALRMCGLSMLAWAVVILLATLAGEASLSACAWSAFVATACWASDRSLAVREV